MQQTLDTVLNPAGDARVTTLRSTATWSTSAQRTPRVAETAARPYVRNAALALLALVGSIALAYAPNVLDRPVARFANQFAHRSQTLDLVFWSLDGCFLFSGFALVACLWYCWFANSDSESRARILAGSLLAFPAGAISRLLQHTVPSHPRPFYDAAIHFRTPFFMLDKPLNTWNSFPSDHVTVFAALLTTICIARPKLTKWIVPYFILVESSRIYTGAHYTSDLLGGAALGALVIWAAQAPQIVALGRRTLRFEQTAPAWFYLGAFFFTSQMATLFLEARTIGSYFFHIHHR